MQPVPGLRRERLRAVLSIRALAELSGIGHATVVRLEAGRAARPGTIRRLAAALGVEPAALLET